MHRHRQLLSARPGTFVRTPLPRLRTSCNGAIATAAGKDHANFINAAARNSASTKPRYAGRWQRCTACLTPSGPAVALLRDDLVRFLDPGKQALWAHALGRGDGWLLCGPNKARVRLGVRLGLGPHGGAGGSAHPPYPNIAE